MRKGLVQPCSIFLLCAPLIMSEELKDSSHRNVHEIKKIPTLNEVKESMEKRVGERITLDQLLREGFRSCVDGREPREIIGTPGGSAGEFLLMMATFEESERKTIEIPQVQAILRRYIDANAHFYFHTDAHAVDNLKETLGEEIDIKTGKGASEEDFLNALVDPENIGCGHIKYMILHGKEKYNIRPELVKEFIKSLYRLLWDREKKIELRILDDEHTEGAVVKIVAEGEITGDTKIPVVKPNTDAGQIFIYYPQVAKRAREDMAARIEEIIGQPIDEQRFREELENLAGKQLASTVKILGRSLPVYTAFFSQDGELIQVTEG